VRSCFSLPLLLSLLLPWPASAQTSVEDTLRVRLPEVTIEAARGMQTEARAPFAVTLQARSPDELAIDPGLSLERVLAGIPGVQINDRGHFALGERVAIRGMGWRAAFGVRGIHAVLDGIPLTMPDGQAILDIVDPSHITRAEIIRGPSSVFWGNAGGGVLFLSSDPAATAPSFRLRAMGGSFERRQWAATSSATLGRARVNGFLSHHGQSGFRDHSEGHMLRAGLNTTLTLNERSRIRITGALADQDTQAPGSLTRDEWSADSRMADARYVNTSSGKQSRHGQVGMTFEHRSPVGLLTATTYGIARSLDNPLPFAFVRVGRQAGGARLSLQEEAGRLTWGVGVDAAMQRDDRLNFNNDNGAPGQNLRLDQLETVRNVAAFAHGGFALTSAMRITAGLRADRIDFHLSDGLMAGGRDVSGSRSFGAVSPSVGISMQRGLTVIFAGIGTSYETPTTTELVNTPDGSGGFNPDVGPQRTIGFEAGARGFIERLRLEFDIAAFHMLVNGRLVSFTTDQSLGREFYRNAGRSTHSGAELSLQWQATDVLRLEATYDRSLLVFLEEELRGNQLPGQTPQRLRLAAAVSSGPLFGRADAEMVSGFFVDDRNEQRAPGHTLVHMRVGHRGIPLGTAPRLQPFAELNNVFDTDYVASVIVNAAGGRFFEPGQGRSLQVGLSLSF
jgi:iron complex outermembrane recepter protein